MPNILEDIKALRNFCDGKGGIAFTETIRRVVEFAESRLVPQFEGYEFVKFADLSDIGSESLFPIYWDSTDSMAPAVDGGHLCTNVQSFQDSYIAASGPLYKQKWER